MSGEMITGDSGVLLLFCILILAIFVYIVFILIPDCCKWVVRKFRKEEADVK